MKQVRVTYRQTGPKNWDAKSPDLKGYFAFAETLDGLRELVFEGIPLFLREPVEIIETFAELE